MRPRLAITTMLVTGALFSSAGTVLAVNGISASGSAGSAQYGFPVTGETVGGSQPNSPGGTTNPPGGTTTQGGGPTNPQATSPVQTSRQLEAGGGGQLAFTGYAAIPVLLAGMGLLTGGLVMRRRAARSVRAVRVDPDVSSNGEH